MAHWPFIFLLHILPGGQQISTDSIVQVTAPEVIVSSGRKGVIHIYITVKKGYHIQANKVNDEFIIPTTIEINAGDVIATGKPSFPAGRKFRLEETNDYLLVYDGNFRITIPLRAKKKLQKGNYTLDAKLHYQACDNKTCFFPKIIDFSIVVNII